MFKAYIKTAFRQLSKNKLFTLVNVIGLSTGFGAILTLAAMVYQYVTTDSNQVDIQQMYYLKTAAPDGGQYKATTYPLLGEIIKTCPEVESATHIQQWNSPWLKFDNREFSETTAYVDTGYFQVFRYPFKYGNAASALQDKFSIVLSEETSDKIFGKIDPVGKILMADDTMQLKVTGVLKHVPSNSTVRPTVLIPTSVLMGNASFSGNANWYNTFADNYLRLKKGADPKKLDLKIASLVKVNYANEQKKSRVFTVPFSKITQENSSLTEIIIKGSLGAGIFILLIVVVNLINLNTATAYSRAKEVAVKQMIGGTRKNIVMQFCVENGMVVLMSVIFAWLIFSLILLPGINDLMKDKMGEIETGLEKDYPLIVLFTGIALIVTVLAASMPALKLATVKVTDAVKGRIIGGNNKGTLVRNSFITIQFVLAITLITVTLILNQQIGFMKSSALGFNKDNIAVINLDLGYKNPATATARFESILNDLRKNPHVKNFSTNSVIPTSYWENYNHFVDPISNKEINLKQAGADAGYISTYAIPLIQGKNFDDALAGTEKNEVLINRSAMNAFGWTDAIGKQIKPKGSTEIYTVRGVMEDFHYSDLQNGIEPLIQYYAGKPGINNIFFSVKIDGGYVKPVIDQLQKDFKGIVTRRDFSYEMMSDKVDNQYALVDGMLKVSRLVAMLTIVIASLGMFGLIALFAKQRIKEIGIRKVLGADVYGIVILLSRDFIILVGIAILIASPISGYIMTAWLQDFAYHIHISWWMYLIAGLIAISIATITVGIQAIKAALANPIKSLRND